MKTPLNGPAVLPSGLMKDQRFPVLLCIQDHLVTAHTQFFHNPILLGPTRLTDWIAQVGLV
jgi:hypothetical protein